MKKFNKTIVLLLVLVMCMMLMPLTAMAANADGVTYTATLDKATIDTGAEAQQVVMTVKANKKIDTDSVGLAAVIPEGWKVVSMTHTELEFLASEMDLDEGLLSHVTADAETRNVDLIAIITYEVPANVAAGTYTLGIQNLTLSKDYGEEWEDGGAASVTLTVNGAAHTCQHDHYDTTETTHQSVCACGQTIGEAASHTGGTATCNAKAECETCGAEYGNVDKTNHVGETELRDAATASCDKPGYTGDTYCKSCNELIAQGEETPATGKHVDADGAWESDGVNHFHTCGCGAKFDESKHTGGKATCMSGATCESCGLNYGELDPENHAGDIIQKEQVTKEPTCGEPGMKTVTDFCDECMVPVNEKEVEIPATGKHVDADGEWESDGVNHFHTCGCGAKFDEGEHTGGEATCVSGATCESCGLTYGELDPRNHVGEEELVDRSEPTCVEEGYTGDIWCLSCDEMKVRGQILPATGEHAGTYRFTWDWDADHNECTLVVWFHCNTCNNDIAFKNAKDAGVVTKVATCKETGIRTYTFDLSGAELPGNCTWDNFVLLNNDLGDENASWNYQTKVMTLNVVLPIDPSNHVGETEIRGAVKETCGDPGYTGDTHCKDCGAKIAEGKPVEPTGDHKGGTATCIACAVCEVCGQSYGELDPENHAGDIIQNEQVTKEPTCGEPGKKTVTDFCDECMVPVNEKEVEIPATGKHTGGEATCTEKAICEVCGKDYGEKDSENHNWNEKWYQDGKVHWHECDDCHEGRNMKEHYDNDGDKKCDECGYMFTAVPDTGETAVIGIAVVAMFVAACGAVLVFKKRKTVY